MSRAERWWRPAGQRRNHRPGVRSARRGRHAIAQEYLRGYDQAQADAWKAFDEADAFELGYEAGRADEARRSENRDQQIRRLMDAIRAAELGDPGPLDELGRQAAGDDLLDVADAAAVTPLHDVAGELLAAEVEQWLRSGEA